MVDFQLTREQLALQQMVREFVRREILPVVAERERIEDPRERFPWDLIKKASKIGLRTLALPKEHGGGGADFLTRCILLEELAAGDMGIAITFLLLVIPFSIVRLPLPTPKISLRKRSNSRLAFPFTGGAAIFKCQTLSWKRNILF